MTSVTQNYWTKQEEALFNSHNPSFLDKSYIMKPIGLALFAGSLITSSALAYSILAVGFKITIKATLMSSGALFAIELLGLYLILKTTYLDLEVKRHFEQEKESVGISRNRKGAKHPVDPTKPGPAFQPSTTSKKANNITNNKKKF